MPHCMHCSSVVYGTRGRFSGVFLVSKFPGHQSNRVSVVLVGISTIRGGSTTQLTEVKESASHVLVWGVRVRRFLYHRTRPLKSFCTTEHLVALMPRYKTMKTLLYHRNLFIRITSYKNPEDVSVPQNVFRGPVASMPPGRGGVIVGLAIHGGGTSY